MDTTTPALNCFSSCVYIRWLVERETLTPVTPDSGNNLTRQQRHLAVVNLQWRSFFFFPLKLSKLEHCPNCFLGLLFFFNLKLKVIVKGFGVSQVYFLTPKFWGGLGPPVHHGHDAPAYTEDFPNSL